MKKFFVILAVAGLSSIAVAQDCKKECETNTDNKYQVLTNKFWDNWFISAGVGGEFLIGNSDAHGSFSDRISPTFNVAVGKWFTPGLGLRLQYSGYQGKGFRKGFGSFAKGSMDPYGYYKQKFHYMNLHGDVMFNLNALFAGYNAKRVYEIIPYLGAGFTHSYSGSNKSQALAVNFGIINKFRVSNAFDVNVELGSMMVQNKFDRELGGKHDFDGVLSATVGVTYHFKARGFNKPVAPKQLISESELRGLRDRMNDLSAENRNLKDELAKGPKVVTKEVPGAPQVLPYSVFFAIGSSEVSTREMFNVNTVAEAMKSDSNMKIRIIGYADSATGTAALNERLSKNRAQAVADVLVKKHNIDASRIVVEGRGGVDKLDPIYLNRQARVEVIK